MSNKLKNASAPNLGEVEIYLAHIGMDDLNIVKSNVQAFNLIVRYCGGIPQNPPQNGMCATIAFTTKLFREDFAREMRDKLSITAGIDFRRVFVDRRYMPPQTSGDHTMDKYDFSALARKAQYEKEIKRALHPEEIETEYVFPDGKLPA